uniref:Uncharacterized protein n=1 Tax=Anopheles atroparvus TaxID=41427 RepID=A0AAG5CPP7_ANOAO
CHQLLTNICGRYFPIISFDHISQPTTPKCSPRSSKLPIFVSRSPTKPQFLFRSVPLEKLKHWKINFIHCLHRFDSLKTHF